jgi:hypothetical protein
MNPAMAEKISRWRVRAGYPVAMAVFYFARPMPKLILAGAVLGFAGLLVRAYAAGYLHKQEVLTTTGPYAFTRNPLYLGSSLLAVGLAIASGNWRSAACLLIYFSFFYAVVMRREESELLAQHGAAFEEYARRVPLFLPRLSSGGTAHAEGAAFSFAQYRKNHEYQAVFGLLAILGLLVFLWAFHLG